jgi:hypothetical protein
MIEQCACGAIEDGRVVEVLADDAAHTDRALHYQRPAFAD